MNGTDIHLQENDDPSLKVKKNQCGNEQFTVLV